MKLNIKVKLDGATAERWPWTLSDVAKILHDAANKLKLEDFEGKASPDARDITVCVDLS